MVSIAAQAAGQAGKGAPVRRACAYRTATAQEAMRARTESAREVRMIGTRAPSTIPAASALARKLRFLASMFPASRSGTHQHLKSLAEGSNSSGFLAMFYSRNAVTA